MHQALLKTSSQDAKSISKALSVDNEGVQVDTKKEEEKVINKVKAKKIRTLLNTLDDIVHCQMVGEKLLEND